jgi:hypothetical protein
MNAEPRLTVDADTVALCHLGEGGGTVAADSGPNGLDGSLSGGYVWVVAP